MTIDHGLTTKGGNVLEDKLLVWKMKRGSRDAFCRIYEKYRDDLLRLAAGLLNDTAGAEDVVHEVFTEFILAASHFNVTGSLRGYLATCVANRARNFNRSGRRHPALSLEHAEPVVSRVPHPEHWIIADEDFTRLSNAMALLPYEQKEAIILRIQGGLRFARIAALQGTSTQTVVSRYRYGLDKLRSILNGEVTQ